MSIILAFSSGPDSVYLLDKLLKKGENLILAHFNHQLRGTESDEDERFARSTAKKYRLVIEVERKNVKRHAKNQKKSLEEAGRILRYAFFEKIRKKHHATAILTAHHLNDNLETVLMNQKRGCGLKGQIGMQTWNGWIHRPLLSTSKKTILNHLKKQNLSYRIDSSNTDKRFLRNRIRHEVIPEMLKKNPHLLETFKKERQKALKAYKKEKQNNEKWLKKMAQGNDMMFTVQAFKKLSMKKQLSMLQIIYERLYGSTYGLTQTRLTEIQNLILKGQTGTQRAFGKKCTVWIEYGKVEFRMGTKAVGVRSASLFDLDRSRAKPGEDQQLKGALRTGPTKKNSVTSFSVKVDAEKLASRALTFRHWKPGDHFRPSGMKVGTKKLQDYFVDAKIPRRQRARIPILMTEDDQIVAVGTRLDERFKIDQNTKQIRQVVYSKPVLVEE